MVGGLATWKRIVFAERNYQRIYCTPAPISPGWVTIFGSVNYISLQPATQVIPP